MKKINLNSLKYHFIAIGLMIYTPFYSQFPQGSPCQGFVDQFNSNYDAILEYQIEKIGSYNEFEPSSNEFFSTIFEGVSYIGGMTNPTSLLERAMEFNTFVSDLNEAVDTMTNQLLDTLTEQFVNNNCYGS